MRAIVRFVIFSVFSMTFGLSRATESMQGNGSLEYEPVYFPEGRPSQSEKHVDIVALLDETQRQILADLLASLKANPVIGVEIVGYADKNECSPTDCSTLSLLRAKLVFEWFAAHGVPTKQLRGPSSESTDYPADDSGTEEGRSFNRRVQLQPYTVPGAVPGHDD